MLRSLLLIVRHDPMLRAISIKKKNILQTLNCLLTQFVSLFIIGRSDPLPTIFP